MSARCPPPAAGAASIVMVLGSVWLVVAATAVFIVDAPDGGDVLTRAALVEMLDK